MRGIPGGLESSIEPVSRIILHQRLTVRRPTAPFTLVEELKRLSKEFEQKLSLKVVHLSPLDCIVSQKTTVAIFVTKNMPFCRAFEDELKKKFKSK